MLGSMLFISVLKVDGEGVVIGQSTFLWRHVCAHKAVERARSSVRLDTSFAAYTVSALTLSLCF